MREQVFPHLAHLVFMVFWHGSILIGLYQFYHRRGFLFQRVMEIATEKNPNLNKERFRTTQIAVGILMLLISIGWEFSKHLKR